MDGLASWLSAAQTLNPVASERETVARTLNVKEPLCVEAQTVSDPTFGRLMTAVSQVSFSVLNIYLYGK